MNRSKILASIDTRLQEVAAERRKPEEIIKDLSAKLKRQQARMKTAKNPEYKKRLKESIDNLTKKIQAARKRYRTVR